MKSSVTARIRRKISDILVTRMCRSCCEISSWRFPVPAFVGT